MHFPYLKIISIIENRRAAVITQHFSIRMKIKSKRTSVSVAKEYIKCVPTVFEYTILTKKIRVDCENARPDRIYERSLKY